MVEHKIFKGLSITSLLIVTCAAILYNYYSSLLPDPPLKALFILKPIPITVLILNTLSYLFIYRMNTYALFMLVSFLFCLLGDLSLMVYIPSDPKYDNIWSIIIGGISFFIARLFMTVMFVLYPYKTDDSNYIGGLTLRKVIIVGLGSVFYTVFFTIYFNLHSEIDWVMKTGISIYIVLMGAQLFTSAIRVGGFMVESAWPTIFGVAGTVLFTLSDTLMFWDLFIEPIPYGGPVSIDLYWYGIYLLAISVVRSHSERTEKYGKHDYLFTNL